MTLIYERKENMKRLVISVFLVLMMFAFIGCDTTTENNNNSGATYIGYAASESECEALGAMKGYRVYAYKPSDGSCYGSY